MAIIRRLGLIATILHAAGPSASAQDASPQASAVSLQELRALESLALARARRAVVEEVWRMTIRPGLEVGAWVARDVVRDRAVRLWLRTLTPGASPRVFSDGSIDVDVRLASDELHRRLLEQFRLSDDSYPGISEAVLAKAASAWTDIICTGSAEPAERTRAKKPVGWEDVAFEGLEVARRAAAADARAALLDEASRLKISNSRRLRDFLESDPVARAAVVSRIDRIASVKTELAPDQVAVAEARLGMLDLIRLLTEVHRESGSSEEFQAADFREMALLTPINELSATGLAPPPAQYLTRDLYQTIERNAPSWADRVLAVTGRYRMEEGEESLDFAVRADVARIDGIDRLREQVESLIVQGEVRVSEHMALHPELKDDVVLFLGGARLVGRPRECENGELEVSLELPLKRLWWIVRRGMHRIEEFPEP